MFGDEVKHNDIKLSLWKIDWKAYPFLSTMVCSLQDKEYACTHKRMHIFVYPHT